MVSSDIEQLETSKQIQPHLRTDSTFSFLSLLLNSLSKKPPDFFFPALMLLDVSLALSESSLFLCFLNMTILGQQATADRGGGSEQNESLQYRNHLSGVSAALYRLGVNFWMTFEINSCRRETRTWTSERTGASTCASLGTLK